MRVHYKTDFHRFNLKRKIANLLPIAEDMFDKKLLEIESTESHTIKGKQHLKQSKYNNPKTQAHHLKKLQQQQQPQPQIESQKLEKTENELLEEKIAKATRLTLRDSLFDRHTSPDFESNLEYMTKKFSFLIPEIEYLKDLPGLIIYLGEKISIGNVCISCEKSFGSLEATRDHMRKLCHFHLRWEDNEDEYNDFYDIDEVNKRIEALEDKIHVSQFNELVIANKTVGHRALNKFYKQRHSTSNATSLLQEKRLATASEKQRNINQDTIKKKANYSLKIALKNNHQQHYRAQNPL